jgi:hypothetical protein
MAKSAPSSSRSTSAERQPERSTRPPVFTVRHRALKAAVWKNDTENGPMLNTTLSRSYKDGETWKESQSLGFDDLLAAAELLRTCYGFISREMAKQGEEAGE